MPKFVLYMGAMSPTTNLMPPVEHHRFDHLEFCAQNPLEASKVLESFGFYVSQIKAQGEEVLMIQGRLRALIKKNHSLNRSELCLSGIAFHVESAKKALHHARQGGRFGVVQEFLNDEDDAMFLQSSAVDAVCGFKMIFVTRYGAPHDVLSPFGPGFENLKRLSHLHEGMGLYDFVEACFDEFKKELTLVWTSKNSECVLNHLKNQSIEHQMTSDGVGFDLKNVPTVQGYGVKFQVKYI